MDYGAKTNIEIEILLQKGVKVGDEVFSKDWNIKLKFDGFAFKSICGCEFIGTTPYCGDNINCESVTDAYAVFTPE